MKDVAKLFKVLGEESRLAIVRDLAIRPMYAEVLAERLKLSAATVTHHMKKLESVGLVTATKDQYYKVYSLRRTKIDKNILEMVCNLSSQKPDTNEDRYEQKVIKSFIKYGKLTSIPVQRKKRMIILKHIAHCFSDEKTYPEKEVNEILGEFNEDYCTLRRELIAEKLMTRKHGYYQRLPS